MNHYGWVKFDMMLVDNTPHVDGSFVFVGDGITQGGGLT